MQNDAASAKILCLSDVAPGYGSSQLQHFTASLAAMLGDAEVRLICPDQKNRPPRKSIYDDFNIERITTLMPPHTAAFAVEYNLEIAKIIREWQPSVVIASHGWVLPGVLRRAEQSFRLIYYMLESLAHQVVGVGPWAVDLNADAFCRSDIVITPEHRRLDHDMEALNVSPLRELELFNVTPFVEHISVPRTERTRAILAAGAIGPSALSQHLLASPEEIPVCLAGPLDNVPAIEFVNRLDGGANIYYAGMLSAEKVVELRSRHAYSVVMWAPTNVNQIFAAPNKFFETIAVGTPPICAPHPQCAEIIMKYDCGVLMRDWTEGAFLDAVNEAMWIFDNEPDRYEDMVQNCLRAAREELNWEMQFEKFRKTWP